MIERLAEETRHALGVGPDGPVRHVTRACERGGIAVVPLTMPGEEIGAGETVGHFGASCWPGGSEPGLIGFFPGGQGDRQRYTLAQRRSPLNWVGAELGGGALGGDVVDPDAGA